MTFPVHRYGMYCTCSSFNPHLFLQVFIPALIFDSAFSVNFHIIMREFGKALLLAGPGAFMNVGKEFLCGKALLFCLQRHTTADIEAKRVCCRELQPYSFSIIC